MSRSAWYANGSKNLLRLNMQAQCTVPRGNAKDQPSSTFRRRLRTWSFYVGVLQRTAKKVKPYKPDWLILPELIPVSVA